MAEAMAVPAIADEEEEEEKTCLYYFDYYYEEVTKVPRRCKTYVETKWDECMEWYAESDPVYDVVQTFIYWNEVFWLKRELRRVSSRRVGKLRRDQDIHLTPEEIMDVFRKRRPNETGPSNLLIHAFRGDAPLCVLISVWLCAAVFVVGLYFLLALLVFSVPADLSVESGVVAASSGEAAPLATGAVSYFRTLGEYPFLPLSELEMAEDVVLTDFAGARHTLDIAHISRNTSGYVVVTAVDGSAIRVDTSGRIYWTRTGVGQETRLNETEFWVSRYGNDADPNIGVSGSFAEHVIL